MSRLMRPAINFTLCAWAAVGRAGARTEVLGALSAGAAEAAADALKAGLSYWIRSVPLRFLLAVPVEAHLLEHT